MGKIFVEMQTTMQSKPRQNEKAFNAQYVQNLEKKWHMKSQA